MPDRTYPRLELMRQPVRVISESGEMEHDALSEPESSLLRIFAFEPDPLRQEDILDGLREISSRYPNSRETNSLQPMITHIRKAVGSDGVETVTRAAEGGARYSRARYKANLGHLIIDATEFRALCQSLQHRMAEVGEEPWLAPERLPDDFGAGIAHLADGSACDELEMWQEALERHPMNPSVDLDRFSGAYQAYGEFADYIWALVTAVALGYACRYLRTGQDVWLSKAEGRLQRLERDGDVPDQIWHLRFRLVASLPSWRVGLDTMRLRYLRATNLNVAEDSLADLRMPADLESFVQRLRAAAAGKDDPRRVLLRPRVEKPPDWVHEADLNIRLEDRGAEREPKVEVNRHYEVVPSPAAGSSTLVQGLPEPSLVEVATMLGITPASAVALRSSNATPVDCCRQVDKRLWFSGIMANKWVLDPEAYDAFDSLLSELDSYDETDPLCRLLIVDPNSRSGMKLKRRGLITDRELRSLPVLRDLVRRHPSFEVRMYDAMPTFRLIIVDQVFVTVAPYLNVLPDLIPDKGWGVPHLILKPSAEYPLAHSFISLFEQNWDASRQSPLPMK